MSLFGESVECFEIESSSLIDMIMGRKMDSFEMSGLPLQLYIV